MKAKLVTLDKKELRDIPISDTIFGLKVRKDLIKRVVDWQRAKTMRGTHKTKTVSEVSGSGKKPFKQKGTGRARQGTARGVQRRGGGVAFGPIPRSHEISLQKKVRRLGMKHALSAKFLSNSVYIIESITMEKPKTADLRKFLSNFGLGKFFIIDGNQIDRNVRLSIKSLHNACVVPAIGANVYDIINSDYILISKDGLASLEERLK